VIYSRGNFETASLRDTCWRERKRSHSFTSAKAASICALSDVIYQTREVFVKLDWRLKNMKAFGI
jgi:hypothetical protein